mmetsp:Transcript_3529/g.6795  ORF Transcript_3529/g.6795 Transcript_3529/m.6795 type:complete len:219 (+) Transcript_3529:774-1430(+)
MSGAAKVTYAVLPPVSSNTDVTAPCLAHSRRIRESVTPDGSLLMQSFSGAAPGSPAATAIEPCCSSVGANADRPVRSELRVDAAAVLGGLLDATAPSALPLRTISPSSSAPLREKTCATPLLGAAASRAIVVRAAVSRSAAEEASRFAAAVCAVVCAASRALSAATLACSASSCADFAIRSSSRSTASAATPLTSNSYRSACEAVTGCKLRARCAAAA